MITLGGGRLANMRGFNSIGVCYFLKLGSGYIDIYFYYSLCHTYAHYTYSFIHMKYFNKNNFYKCFIIRFRFDALG